MCVSAVRQWVTRLGMLVSLAAGLLTLVGTLPAIEAPFAGFRYYQHGQVARVLEHEWTGTRAGIRITDRIVAYDGHPWQTANALDAYVAARPTGTIVRYTVERPDATGRARSFDLPVATQRFAMMNWTVTILAWWIVGTLSLVIGWLLLLARPKDLMAATHAGVLIGFGTMLTVIEPDAALVHRLITQGHLLCLSTYQGMMTTIVVATFPRPLPGTRLIAGLSVATGLAVMGAIAVLGPIPLLEVPTFVWAAASPLLYLVRVGRACVDRSLSDTERARARWLAMGLIMLIGSLVVPLFAEMAGHPLPFAWSLTFLATAYPLAVAIAVARYGFHDVDRLFRPTVLYTLLTAMLGLTYFLLASALRAALGDQPLPTAVLATAGVALTLAPLRDATRTWLDRTFFRRPYDMPSLAAALSRQARETLDPEKVRQATLAALDKALSPGWGAIYENAGEPWPATATVGDAVPPCQWQGLTAGEAQVVGDTLVLTLAVDGPAFGVLAVGPKRSGLPFSAEDRALVTMLGHQLGLWLDLLARMERELTHRRTIETLEQEERMHTEFLNLVNHELRTPASAVMQALALAATESDAGRRTTYHGRMQRNMEALMMLLDDMLQAGRLQMGGFRLAERDVDPLEVVSDVVEQLQPLAEPRGIAIVVDPPGDLEPIWADPHRLAQIWRNLIHNALKYGRAAGTVRITLSREGDLFRGVVRDDGPGIAEADRPTLFQRFRPGHGAPRQGGIGLGLYICRALVQAHGGEIGVETQPGQGASFWFTLPA